MKKYVAELIGTMVLVLLGCGSAVFAGGVADTVGAGVGTIGVAMAFGLSVIAMAYTIGNISGCHINPAITLGVWLSGGMKTKRALMYMLFQVVGAIIGSLILTLLVSTGAHGGPTIQAPTALRLMPWGRRSWPKPCLPLSLCWWRWLPRTKRKELATWPDWPSDLR